MGEMSSTKVGGKDGTEQSVSVVGGIVVMGIVGVLRIAAEGMAAAVAILVPIQYFIWLLGLAS